MGESIAGAAVSGSPNQSDAESARLNRYENNAIQSSAPDQGTAETARFDRYESSARDQEWIAQDDAIMGRRADEAPLPRTADGGVMLPDGRVVHPSVAAGPLTPVNGVTPAFAQPGMLFNGPNGPMYSGAPGDTFVGAAFDTRIPVRGPMRQSDGSPLTYTFDQGTGKAYWRSGDQVVSIPAPYATPSLDDLTLDPSNPFTQGPRMKESLIGFGLTTATGVAGMLTGGWAFGAMRAGGYGLLASGGSAGFVGDLTTQVADNGVSLATDSQYGRTGINNTELALSTGLGALPGLPSAVRGFAEDLRGMGVRDWNIRMASPYSINANGTGLELERIEGSQVRLRDEATGRFVADPENPPSPYTFTDAQRRAAWRDLAQDPNAPITESQRAEIQDRGWRGPQRVNEYGEIETMELSHEPVPLRQGGTTVVPRWPADHAAVDPYRQLKNR